MPQPLRHSGERIAVLIVTADNNTGELLRNEFARPRQAFSVAMLTGTSHKIINQLGLHKPNVALISEELQDGPEAGMRVLHKIREYHRIPSIMLLLDSSSDRVVKSFRDGARGVFYRSNSLKALTKCIRTVHSGQIWVGNEDLEHLMKALAHSKPVQFKSVEGTPLLTHREEQVVRLVADGMKNREIAQLLNVKEHSIRNYLYRIYDKLGVSTRVELILYTFSQRDRSS
jgi:DNA-binding NarL/FixJ family response regulator